MEKVGIPLSAIRKGKTDFFFDIKPDPAILENNRVYVDIIHVKAVLSVLGEDVLLKLNVEAQTSLYCDRCGEKFESIVSGHLTTLFTPDPLKIEGAEGGELRLFDSRASTLDLTPDVTDALILAVPEKLICQESCKGLCSQCGVNLNRASCTCRKDEIDPRWDALKKLKSDQ